MSVFLFLFAQFALFLLFIFCYEFFLEEVYEKCKIKCSNDKLFWCRNCNNFYFGSDSESTKECEHCNSRNARLSF